MGLGVTGLLGMGVGWPAGVALWLWRKGRQPALNFSDYSLVLYTSYGEMYNTRYIRTV